MFLLKTVEDFMLDVMECMDESHDRTFPRPFAEWRVTLSDDNQEFDCAACFEWRMSWLLPFTPLTVVRIRGVANRVYR